MGVTQAAAASDVLPNLVADPPTGAELDVNMGQLLLRFDGYVHNAGPGPFEVRGQRASTADPMIAYQRIYQTDGGFRDMVMPGAQMVYAANDGHQHWHLQNVAAYSLWNSGRTQQVAPAMKVGFCLADSEHVDAVGPTTAVYSDSNGRAFCQKNNPDALSVFEGVSAGWRDLYEKTLVFQWVDVSDVQPGMYWLREDVDPNGIVREASPVKTPPAYATAPSTIPGYDARPLALGAVAIDSPTAIALGADHYGTTGAVQFRVDTAPAHGTLSVTSGSLSTDPNISYQPNPGYRGPDSFTYVAQDSASSYPHHPAEATVSLNVGPVAVPTVPPSPVAPVNTSPPKTPGTFTAGQIKISLRSALTPPRKAARIRALLKKGGFSFSFKALAPGRLVISWYLVPKGSHPTKHRPKPILVATGQLTFSTAQTAKIDVKLTAVGKTLLRHAKGIRLTATGSFTPRGKPAIITTKIFALLR
jgi:hypothetical protein